MRLRVEVDFRLVEEAVFRDLHRRGSEDPLAREYRARRDACYDLGGGEGDRAFRALDSRFFVRLGFDGLLRGTLRGFPVLGAGVDRLLFRLAATLPAEGAELYAGPRAGGARTAVAVLRAERFLDLPALAVWLQRELLHVADMVDPAFGYEPWNGFEGASAGAENLVRDRYRVLWDAWVDLRLARAGRIADWDRAWHAARLGRVFRSAAADRPERLLDEMARHEELRHRRLLGWAGGGRAGHLARGGTRAGG